MQHNKIMEARVSHHFRNYLLKINFIFNIDVDDYMNKSKLDIVHVYMHFEAIVEMSMKHAYDMLTQTLNVQIDQAIQYAVSFLIECFRDEQFGKHVKPGFHEDSTNRTNVFEHVRFHASLPDAEQISLTEYVNRTKEGQNDIYYLFGFLSQLRENVRKKSFEAKYRIDPMLLTETR